MFKSYNCSGICKFINHMCISCIITSKYAPENYEKLDNYLKNVVLLDWSAEEITVEQVSLQRPPRAIVGRFQYVWIGVQSGQKYLAIVESFVGSFQNRVYGSAHGRD